MYIFRPWITRKDGTKDYAKNHGKRAFRFWVGPGPEPAKKKNLQLSEMRRIYQLDASTLKKDEVEDYGENKKQCQRTAAEKNCGCKTI